MTRQQVEEFTTLATSTIYDKMNSESVDYDPSFPLPIKLGKKKVAWVKKEIVMWIKKRMEFHRAAFKKNEIGD